MELVLWRSKLKSEYYLNAKKDPTLLPHTLRSAQTPIICLSLVVNSHNSH